MSLNTLCRELFCEVLEAVVPNRTKRLIVISSLCPVVSDEPDVSTEYLTMLNTQLSLCREENALQLPLNMSQAIWKQFIDNESTLENKDPTYLASRIITYVPEWLKYDKDAVILDEVQTLLHFNEVYKNVNTQVHLTPPH